MKTFKLTLAVLMASAGLATAALAQDMDKSTTSKSTTTTTTTQTKAQKGDRDTYRAAKKQADETYKASKKQCDAIGTASTGKENCIGIARAERNYSHAQAKAQYRATEKNMRDAQIASVNLDYVRAKAKCETMGGNVKETGTEVSACMAKVNEARDAGLAAAKSGKDARTSSSTMDKAKSATTTNKGTVGQER